jgi:hypothetical protein
MEVYGFNNHSYKYKLIIILDNYGICSNSLSDF